MPSDLLIRITMVKKGLARIIHIYAEAISSNAEEFSFRGLDGEIVEYSWSDISSFSISAVTRKEYEQCTT